LDEVRALIARALARGLAADRHRAVLDGDVDVLGTHAWQRSLDRQLVGVCGDVKGEARPIKATGHPAEGAIVVIEKAVHRLSEGHHLPEGRRPAHDRHRSYTSCVRNARHLLPDT